MGGRELLDPAEMAEADRMTIAAGVPSFTLMERAGEAVAEAARSMLDGGIVLVMAGPGNTGGDGFVAAKLLGRSGYKLRVALLGSRERLSGDAARAAEFYTGPIEALTRDIDLTADLIIDALVGAGLSRSLDAEALAIVEKVNGSGRAVLAVDLPTGIDGRTGEVRGGAIRARKTVTFFRLKPGHLLLPGRAHCGQTIVANIGIESSVLAAIRPKAAENGPDLWRENLPRPDLSDHKYARGHVVVISGPMISTGAARLAAAGALRAGAGVVTVASPPDALLVNAAQLTAIMLRRIDGAADLAGMLADPRPTAAVLGPGNGVGAETRANVEAALASNAAVVLDADALTSFAAEPAMLFDRIRDRAARVVLTPHEGEFARLFAVGGPKIDRARMAAERSGAILVMKGADTVVAAPDGRMAINSNAPPDLATAGSGDVLAGIIAGLLAQAMPAFEAAAAGVWLHGAAGAALGCGLTAEDLPAALPNVLKHL